MRKILHQYFKPTKEELRELWEHGLFSFDASVLLNVYGYSGETRDQLVDFIEKMLTAYDCRTSSLWNMLVTEPMRSSNR